MSFDINKPFTRRDGKEVLWCHEYYPEGIREKHLVYGVKDSEGYCKIVEVYASGGMFRHSENPWDLINTPEYEYRCIYDDAEIGQVLPFDAVMTSTWSHRIGYLKREVGTEKWSLISLEEL